MIKRKAALTTGEIATHCHVSPDTVVNWIKSGKLKSYATPGKHRRIHVGDFKVFLNDHNLPPYKEDSAAKRRVLVVDDDPSIVQIISYGLSQTDQYEVATASDGFEAGLEVLRFNPELIILDLKMPNMDGFTVCERIKSNSDTNHIKILVVSGYASEENIQRALECGADDYMAKPFKIEDLNMKIDELFQKKQASGSTISLTA